MLRPIFYRTAESSSGEKIVGMISQKLSRISHNLHFDAQGDVVTVTSKQTPVSITGYFNQYAPKQEIRELIRML